jgi:hypothetical protein
MINANPVDVDFDSVCRDSGDTLAETFRVTGTGAITQITATPCECAEGRRETDDDNRAAVRWGVHRVINPERDTRAEINPEREDSEQPIHETPGHEDS